MLPLAAGDWLPRTTSDDGRLREPPYRIRHEDFRRGPVLRLLLIGVATRREYATRRVKPPHGRASPVERGPAGADPVFWQRMPVDEVHLAAVVERHHIGGQSRQGNPADGARTGRMRGVGGVAALADPFHQFGVEDGHARVQLDARVLGPRPRGAAEDGLFVDRRQEVRECRVAGDEGVDQSDDALDVVAGRVGVVDSFGDVEVEEEDFVGVVRVHKDVAVGQVLVVDAVAQVQLVDEGEKLAQP